MARPRSVVTAMSLLSLGFFTAPSWGQVSLTPIGSYAAGNPGEPVFDQGAAEIPAYDPLTQRLFVVNGFDSTIDVLDLSDPTLPSKVGSLSFAGITSASKAQSVAVRDGVVAVAIGNVVDTSTGYVGFYDSSTLNLLGAASVGVLPDMLAFGPGNTVLAADEGQPNQAYTVDPIGSVSIVDYSDFNNLSTTSVGFGGISQAGLDPSIRVFGPGASLAQDFEPEYISVNGNTAYISLQENNAIATIDIPSGTVTNLFGLGFKDHRLADSGFVSFDGINNSSNGLDIDNRDAAANIITENLRGVPMPDTIAAYTVAGVTYIVTANEGDTRDYDGFSEEAEVQDLTLNPANFTPAEIARYQTDNGSNRPGRLSVLGTDGDGGDGIHEEVFVPGTRSFSIYTADGTLVYDSGDDFERITAITPGVAFNASNTNNSFDNRSDNKGPEPEGMTLAQIDGRTYAFIGLERVGGVMVYDITDPLSPDFIEYANFRDFSLNETALESAVNAASGTLLANLGSLDLGPEGLVFISAADSPTGRALLVVANEVSGTTTIYSVPEPATAAMLLALAGFAIARRRRVAR